MPLSFPFWAVLPHEAEQAGELPLLFSTTDKMTAYLRERLPGRWETRLVGRGTLMPLVTYLRVRGSRGAMLDPEPDGEGGSVVPVADLLTLNEQK